MARKVHQYLSLVCVACRRRFYAWDDDRAGKEKVCDPCAANPEVQRKYGKHSSVYIEAKPMLQEGLAGFPQKKPRRYVNTTVIKPNHHITDKH